MEGGASGGEPPVPAGAEPAAELFSYAALVDHLRDPREQQLLRTLMKAFEGPEETEEEDGRGLYHDTRHLLRYLRARKGDPEAAEDSLRSTGRWRRSFDVAGLLDGDARQAIEPQCRTGKLYVRGFDRHGRPAIYMKPRNETYSDTPEMLMRHVVYCMERAVSCIDRRAPSNSLDFEANDPAAGKFVFCVDFGGCSLGNMVPPSVAREMVGILQEHYPQRLGQAFVFNAPWVLDAFAKVVSPFVRARTLEKFEFVSDDAEERTLRMGEVFDLAQLEPDFGGTASPPFAPETWLGRKREGTEFGLEFNEQAAMAEAKLPGADTKEAPERDSKATGSRARRDAARKRVSVSHGFTEDARFRLCAPGQAEPVHQALAAVAT